MALSFSGASAGPRALFWFGETTLCGTEAEAWPGVSEAGVLSRQLR